MPVEPMELKGLIKWLEDSSYLARVAVNASHANGIDESIREIKRFSEALELGMQKPIIYLTFTHIRYYGDTKHHHYTICDETGEWDGMLPCLLKWVWEKIFSGVAEIKIIGDEPDDSN